MMRSGEHTAAGKAKSSELARTRKRIRTRPPQLKGLLCRQIVEASQMLRDPGLDDEAVHRARKELKRARASLRLLRPVVGERAYALDNAALRDAARPLSALRDAKVIVETLEDFLKHEKNAARAALLVKLRGLLDQSRVSAWQALKSTSIAVTTTKTLDRAYRRVERRNVPRNGTSLLEEGLQRIYRKGRDALKAVHADCTPENLHEWRKHVKYLGNALGSFDGVEARALAKTVKRLETIADHLGDDHDLVVLQQEVARHHPHSGVRAELFAEIEARRQSLQHKALKRGRTMFKAKPRAFVTRIQSVL